MLYKRLHLPVRIPRIQVHNNHHSHRFIMSLTNRKKHDAHNRSMPADQDITRLQATITDLISIGNSMYNPTTGSVTTDIMSRNKELNEKKMKIQDEIKEQESIINRTNRDFTDVRDQLPETLPTQSLHFIEDYTIVILCISYFFMIIVALHIYVMNSAESFVTAMLRGLLYSFLLTLISGMILYYIC